MGQNDKSTSNTFPWKEILGVLGVVLAAYIGYLGIRSQIEIPIQATQTAQANNASDIVKLPTIAPSTTLIPTITPTANVGAYNGLENDCIESKFWAPYIQNEVLYPSDKECLELFDFGISTQNNKLLFSVSNTNKYLTKGIYTSVLPNTEISFTVLVSTPKKYSAQFSYMGFGIGDANSEPVKGGFLYYRIDEAPANTIETGDWWGTFTNKVMQKYSLNQEYDIIFSIGNNDFSIFVDGILVGTYNLSSKQDFFWISYRVPPDGELQVSISNFTIKSK